LVLPPKNAPHAYLKLAHSFIPMMRAVGVEVLPLGMHTVDRQDTILFTWPPGSNPVHAHRSIELFVDGDWAPSPNIERVYPSYAWRDWLWGRYNANKMGPVIPNWIDHEAWPLGPVQTDDYVLYIGRLVPAKTGVLAQLAQQMPGTRFIAAGEGHQTFPSNVTMLGWVQQHELALLAGKARAVLCPSLYCEPFGLAAVEAGMTGARVLASDVGAFRETIPPESMLLDPYDVDAWVNALSEDDNPANRLLRRLWHIDRHSPTVIGKLYAALLAR
jgi:glycosyltransferase involved in cell wall biosynthesis